jgi:hypothetical protein
MIVNMVDKEDGNPGTQHGLSGLKKHRILINLN